MIRWFRHYGRPVALVAVGALWFAGFWVWFASGRHLPEFDLPSLASTPYTRFGWAVGVLTLAIGIWLPLWLWLRPRSRSRRIKAPRRAPRGRRGKVAALGATANGGRRAATTPAAITMVIPALRDLTTTFPLVSAALPAAGTGPAGDRPPDFGRPTKLRPRAIGGARGRLATGSGRGSEPVALPGGGLQPAARHSTPALAAHAASAARAPVSARVPGRDLQTLARPAAVNDGPQGEINNHH